MIYLSLREAEEDLAEAFRAHGLDPYRSWEFVQLRYMRLLYESQDEQE
jgi:hypothetical protein